jgi:hypothetical protein
MTRGKIIFIDKDCKVYSTVEFNGEMYPGGYADEVLEKFEAGFFETYYRYENFVERFNKRHYKYPENLIEPLICLEERVVNVADNWTDYLYIINNSECEWAIKDKNGITLLGNRSLAIVNFQEVERIEHSVIHTTLEPIDYKLSRDEFERIIDRLRESTDLVSKVDELFRDSRDNVECDFCNGASLQISHESIVVLLLKKIMRDTYDNIGYFIYELDYGRKYAPGMIKDENNQDIDFSTAGKLYDFLVGGLMK